MIGPRSLPIQSFVQALCTIGCIFFHPDQSNRFECIVSKIHQSNRSVCTVYLVRVPLLLISISSNNVVILQYQLEKECPIGPLSEICPRGLLLLKAVPLVGKTLKLSFEFDKVIVMGFRI